jgi:hypothetical protein
MINYHINFKKAGFSLGLSLDSDLIVCRDPLELESEKKEASRKQDYSRE